MELGDVEAVQVDVASKTVQVERGATDEAIREAIESAGYELTDA